MARRHLQDLLVIAIAIAIVVALMATLALRNERGQAAVSYLWSQLRGHYTVEERIQMHGSAVAARLQPRFAQAQVTYPPAHLAYVAFKDTAELHVYARAAPSTAWRFVHTYPILGLSGVMGPKLREGDLQVPEGLYRAEFLNANSRFHLSIRLDYPNEFDRARAATDGRTQLGSDIMIHGTASSIGCLAVGNQAAEDLFILAALTGKENLEIIVAPTDLRLNPAPVRAAAPAWLPELYTGIQAALRAFPRAASEP